MVEEQFYVRIRGRVQGPYEAEKLRALVRRGQLSRMHEVSNDRVIWKQAADFPDLFSNPEVRTTKHDSQAAASPAAIAPSEPDEVLLPDAKEWYYAKNNVQNGPVTFEHLKALTQAGAVVGEDLVWKEGMSDWRPAWQIQGLHTIPLMAGSPGRGAAAGNEIHGDIVRTLADSKAWSSFISVCINTWAVLMLLLSFAVFLLGVRHGRAPDTAGGLFGLLWGSIVLGVGILFAKYNSNVRRFLTVRTSQQLDIALRSLRSLWVLIAIILLISLVNLVAVIIWAFAAGVAVDELL